MSREGVGGDCLSGCRDRWPMAWDKMVPALIVANLLLLDPGRRTANAHERVACEESGTLSEFIACLKGPKQLPAGGGLGQVCSSAQPVAIPVAGRRLVAFGDQTEHSSKSKGIVIESAVGAPVSAPVSGAVLFSGGWRDYGQLIIVDAGCSVDVLIAGLLTVYVASGERVERSAIIGKMSEYASPDPPVLYLEVWESGTPVNPER
jgi:murein DD-endopeptidase MepM/ murein hydrolase activator NlpD